MSLQLLDLSSFLRCNVCRIFVSVIYLLFFVLRIALVCHCRVVVSAINLALHTQLRQ